jgi:hypothetical protein
MAATADRKDARGFGLVPSAAENSKSSILLRSQILFIANERCHLPNFLRHIGIA